MKLYVSYITNFFFIVALLVLGYFSVESYSSWREYTLLRDEGVPIDAQILELDSRRNSKGNNYMSVLVEYSIDERIYSREILVTQQLFSTLAIGDISELYYLSDSPETINFYGNTYFYTMAFMIIILDLAAIGFLLFIYLTPAPLNHNEED